MQKPRRILSFSILLALIGAVAVFQPDRPDPVTTERPVRQASADEVVEVNGQPTTALPPAPGRPPASAVAGEVVAQTDRPDALASFGSVRPAGPGTYLVSVSQSEDLSAAVARVKSAPGVTNAGPNYVARATLTPDDPQYPNQWALPKMNLPTAWDRTTGSVSTVIASLDTGVKVSHPDFAGKVFLNTADTPGNAIDDDANGYVDDANGMDFVNANFVGGMYVNDANGAADDEGHGTLTSSIFAAATNNSSGMASVNWAAKVMPVKVLDSNGFGSFVDVANGIRYATDNGAKVINLSLGAQGVTSDFNTDQAIAYAISQGVILVAASGNDGSPTVISYPAINASMIAVGASTSTDTVAGYSNGGAQLSVVAPGSSAIAANYSTDGYLTASGTSLAAPHAAGVAGLLAGLQPNLTQGAAKLMLQNGADKPVGMGGQTRTDAFGSGRINALGALNQIPAYSAQFIRQSANPTVSVGQQTVVSVDYQNTGSQTWQAAGSNPVRLGTSGPRDRGSGLYATSWLSPSRVGSFVGTVDSNQTLTTTTAVAPGETARFQFTVTGPPTAISPINERFEPVVEGIAWLGSPTTYAVTIPGRTIAYQYAGQVNPPVAMTPDQVAAVSIDIQNTGNTYWRRDGLYPIHLATARPTDRGSGFAKDWLSANRLPNFAGRVDGGSVTNTESIAPGETARFQFDIKAISQFGFFPEYFRPVMERVGFLSDVGIYLPIVIPPPPPPYDFQIIGQTAYPSLQPNQQTTLQLNLKNIGTQTWSSNGATPTRLATDRPFDRGSGFSQDSGSLAAGWLSTNRIKLTRNLTDVSKNIGGETTIAPNEVGQFEFVVKANAGPGYYPEYFRPVVDGIAAMKDVGIWWGINIIGTGQGIQVGVTQQATGSFSSTGPVTLKTEAGETLPTIPAGQAFGLTYTGNYVADTAAGQIVRNSPIHAEQVTGAVLTVNNLADNGSFNRFRGNIYIKAGSPGVWLVNQLELESYLKSMGEVPDSWPLESIKAQTVAARTFAARKINAPRNEVFDIYDTTSDQVYNGYNSEIAKPNHATAVTQTNGVVVYYAGQLAQTFYSSDTGGATANSEDVYGGSTFAYLRAVADPYEKPDVWSKVVSQATLQGNYGHSGNIDAINVTQQYAGDRIKTLQLVTNGGSVTNHTLPSDTHRSKLGLRSGRVTGLGRSGNDWVFAGRGFGHGLGMGQWGAFNQANQGRNYQQILSFYYQGVNLGQF